MGAALVHFLTDGPEWVILGAKQRGNCMVVASTSVRTAEIATTLIDDYTFSDWFAPFHHEVRMELTAEDFALVIGPDYATCLAQISDLLRRWERDGTWQGQRAQKVLFDEAPPTLVPGTKALPWGG